jgi:hypothetical protein
MITELVVNVLFAPLYIIIDLLPILTLPTEILGGLAGIIELLCGVTFIMPVGTLSLAIAWWWMLQNTKFVISIVNWIIRKIPGVD